MKYEKPQIAELIPAISAIRDNKQDPIGESGHDVSPAYEDWE